MKKQVCLSVFVLILAALLLASCAGQRSSTPQDRISATLSALGVTDAEFAEQVHAPESHRDGCLLYLSDITKMGYFFDPDTGTPVSILRFDLLDSPYRENDPIASTPMMLPAENREEALLRYATDLIGEDLIGQLQVRVNQDQGLLHNYTVIESYDGIETGTAVGFTSREDGSVSTVRVEIGSIFEPGPFGTWVIAAGEELIGEEAAVEIARAGLQAMEIDTKTISDDATCELTAAEDLLIYTVRISFTDGSDNVREYLAGVNAHTGELWREGISK